MADPPLEALKHKHRAVWDSGDYAAVSDRMISEFGARLVERSGVGSGDEVLDVAAGAGNVTLPLAAAGATVTALDLAPGLLKTGRQRAEAAALEITWVEGDAESLPFGPESFDVVTSVVGIQFAPRHAVVAAELARVLRPGGRLWLFNWTPEGYIGQLLRMIGGVMPPPPDFATPPPLWGDDAHVRELLADKGIELRFERETVISPAGSAKEYVDYMAAYYGPLIAARAALESDGRWPSLRQELIALSETFYVIGNGERPGVAAEYLVVAGHKGS